MKDDVNVNGQGDVTANDAKNVDNVQEMSSGQGNEEVKTGSEAMPEPETKDYNRVYGFSDKFRHDLEVVLGEEAYSTASWFLGFVDSHKEGVTASELNEFVNKIASLKYRIVSPLMSVVSTVEGQKAYFPVLK